MQVNFFTKQKRTHSHSKQTYGYQRGRVVVVLSRVQLFVTPRTVAHQAPLSMEFSRQEYWRGSSFPPPKGGRGEG